MDAIKNYDSITDSNNFMVKIFFRMFLGLMATAIVSFITYTSGWYMKIFSSSSYAIVAIIEVAVVLIFSLAFRKLSPIGVTFLFYLYSFINGITLSFIFAAFNINTVFQAFFMTALLFGVLALYGYKTQKDISKIGPIFMVALIVGLIVSIVNLFLRLPLINIAMDWIILLVFCGLTVYDINKIKRIGEVYECDSEKLYIYGAMELYLDFINIFIRILSVLARGSSRRS